MLAISSLRTSAYCFFCLKKRRRGREGCRWATEMEGAGGAGLAAPAEAGLPPASLPRRAGYSQASRWRWWRKPRARHTGAGRRSREVGDEVGPQSRRDPRAPRQAASQARSAAGGCSPRRSGEANAGFRAKMIFKLLFSLPHLSGLRSHFLNEELGHYSCSKETQPSTPRSYLGTVASGNWF